MAMLRLYDADYGRVTKQVKDVAAHGEGGWFSMLEGGYRCLRSEEGAVQHLKVMPGLNQ